MGIWYEPGSKVFRLLETLDYRWIDVLPQLLAENPTERPSKLGELAANLCVGGPRSVAAVSETVSDRHLLPGADATERVPPVRVPTGKRNKRCIALVLVGVAVLVIVAVVCLIWLGRAVPSEVDDFSSDGIYEVPST